MLNMTPTQGIKHIAARGQVIHVEDEIYSGNQ